MRHIRFAPEMVEAIKQGRKTMTFRLTPKEIGDYIVDEGGHSIYEHIDTGVRIRILSSFYVGDIVRYADDYSDKEGFNTPLDFLHFIRKLYPELNYPSGYAHVFEVLSK